MSYARIIGTGSYLPERVLTNTDLEKILDTSDAWIQSRTGIRERHLAAPGQNTCDLAEQAARRALEAAGLAASELDLIILATTTPDRIFPSTASLLQHRLGISGCPVFDLQAVCAGFVYALTVADKFIRTGSARHVLVVGAEIFSRILDWTDRGTAVLFGDGAGAVVLSASDKPGILSTHLHADGQYHEHLTVPGHPAAGRLQEGSGFCTMQGGEVFKFAVANMALAAEEALNANGLSQADLDWLVPHQANSRIISAVAKKLKFSEDRVILTVGEHGNTSAASVPLALDLAVRDGRIQRNQKILLVAMGGGFTWGSALLVY
jgi:3-oxoacyl-[acyl-carrier-protein] synthase III